MHNKIDQVRLNSRFSNFEILDLSQAMALEALSDLADQVIANADYIVEQQYPFTEAALLFLYGLPGCGKTHLVESFINKIRDEAPAVCGRMILSLDFCTDFAIESSPYGNSPIVIIDDIYARYTEVTSLSLSEVRYFMELIIDLYDHHRLVIITSNFALLHAGIMGRVSELDKVGRVISRAQEVLSLAGELEIRGPDFRKIIAERRRGQGVNMRMGLRSDGG